MIKGLPPLDVPFHMQEPNSCLRCKHSFYEASDREQRYLRCSRWQPSQQCRYQRHETGNCQPDAKDWKARGT